MKEISKEKERAIYLQRVAKIGDRLAKLPLKDSEFASRNGFDNSEVSLVKNLRRIPRLPLLERLEAALDKEEKSIPKPKYCKACGQEIPRGKKA